MSTLRINHAAVWVASIGVQVIRPLWYDKVFFGIRWMELSNYNEEDFTDFNMALGMSLALASAVAAAYTMAWIFTRINVKTGLEGMKYALFIWLGFRILEITTQNMFSLRPFELTLVDETAVLVQYQIIGVILGAWKKRDKNTNIQAKESDIN